MLPLVEFPELVQHDVPAFEPVFSPAAFVQFQRSLSGLIVAEHKTVEGINRVCVVESRHQSSLNRLLTESPFRVTALNQARLALLQDLPGTRRKPHGVLSVDDTRLTHDGQHFEAIAKRSDPKEHRHVWAHHLVTLHSSDDATDYPIDFQRWKPAALEPLEAGLVAAGIPLREAKRRLKTEAPDKWKAYLLGVWRRHSHRPEVAAWYDSTLRIAEHVLTRWVAAYPALRAHVPVTFDHW